MDQEKEVFTPSIFPHIPDRKKLLGKSMAETFIEFILKKREKKKRSI